MERELNYQLESLQMKSQCLDKYWYTLKLFTHGMHATYRLFHKFLLIYGNKEIYDKSNYHYLVYGSQSTSDNCYTLCELFTVVNLQVAWIGCLVRLNNDMKAMKDAAMIFRWIWRFCDMLLWHYDVLSEYTHNRLPMKYNFM